MILSRRKLFALSERTSADPRIAERRAISPAQRRAADYRAVENSRSAARAARVLADQKTRNFIEDRSLPGDSVLSRHRPFRQSRRVFLASMAATVASTQAFADTPFTSFAFPGTGFPTSRTTPARIADIFNVLDFGADPTGVADSQPAIQRAINGSGGANSNGTIFFPKGSYKVNSAILVPGGSSLQFIGEGTGSSIAGTFNGFIFDNLSNPYNAVGAPSSFENLNIGNGYGGNGFTVTANGTWSSSGSPVNITLSGSNPGVAVGGALYTKDARASTNTIFVGMITSVASWPTITVSSAAVGSGGISNLALFVVQCYAASGAFNGPSSGTINSYTYNSGTGLVTLTLASPTTLSANNVISVSDLNIAGLNGTFTVTAPVSASTTVTYTGATGQGGSPSGGGSISWLGAAQITMATTPAAGISGQYYIYDFESILADPKANTNIGVATWSGTTLTFTSGTGSSGASVGSSDRLWFAPVAGGIRLSSVVGAIVQNCFISGFIGLTSSEDKINSTDPTNGSAQAFHIKVDTCTMSGPLGCQAAPGQTGIYLQNNSIAQNINATGMWCAIRISGTACSVIGGRFEVNYFAIIAGGDGTPSNGGAAGVVLQGFGMESNLLGIYTFAAGATLSSLNCICNAISPIGGIYMAGLNGVVNNCDFVGNFGVSGFAISLPDPGSTRGTLAIIGTTAINQTGGGASWVIPTKAWWGTCIQSNNPALVYTVANLPGISTNPAALEGDEFSVSDASTSTWGATVTSGGGSNHVLVRYNGTNWTVVGK